MRPLLLLLALAVLVPALPTAAAHVCGQASGGSASSDCGPCVDGEDHAHGSASGGSGSADGCVSYARRDAPAPAATGLLVLVGAAALALRRA